MSFTLRRAAAAIIVLAALFALPAFAQVTTRTVTGTIRKPDGGPWVAAKVTFELTKNTYTSAATFPATTVTATTNASGLLCVAPCSVTGVTLWTNAEGLAPAQYKVTYPDGAYFYGNLAAGAALDLSTWRASSSTPATPSNQTVLQSIVDAHAAAADPHAVYLTQAEADLLYAGGGGALDELSDVAVSSPAAGHALVFDGSLFVNRALTKADVGLSNVDNTADASKPVSAAQAAALDLKADASALTAEASVRAAADTTLQTNITAEATARGTADTTLQSNIDAEASARGAADSALTTSLAGKAASAHAHAAGDVASGTLATARLGSGTADSTTFLRGDQTWATVSATINSTNGVMPVRLNSTAFTDSPLTVSGGLVGVNKSSSVGAQLHVVAGSAGTTAAIFQMAASPTANPFEVQGATGSVFVKVSPIGALILDGGSNVQSNYLTDLTNSVAYLMTATDSTHAFTLYNRTASKVPLSVQGAGSQTADLQQWQNPSGTALASVSAAGASKFLSTQIGTTTAKGACDLAARGTLYTEFGGAGVADKIFQCLKGSADTYSWVQIAPAP
jgi:hypothetical protein